MTVAAKLKPINLDAFDASLEQQPDGERWELLRGRMLRMMVGARWEHHRIIHNLTYELRRRFDELDSPCRIFAETFRLRDAESQSSLLPDLIVLCHPLPPAAASLDDPTVVVEVLSDGTSRRDRVEKWGVYRGLPSLRHGVLITRDTAKVEIFDRDGQQWSDPRILAGLDASLELPAVGASIPLSRIYRDVLL